jgi:anti-anti-sigma regulatory factor
MHDTRIVVTPDDQTAHGHALKVKLSRLRRGPVVIDLTGLTSIDSGVLGSIADLRRRLPQERIVLAGLDPAMVRLLHVVGLNTRFELGTERLQIPGS